MTFCLCIFIPTIINIVVIDLDGIAALAELPLQNRYPAEFKGKTKFATFRISFIAYL